MKLRDEVVVITIPECREATQAEAESSHHGLRQTKTAPMSPWARLMVGYFAKSALTSFKAWIAFVDDVDPAATAHNTAAFLAQLGRLQRVPDFHNPIPDVKIKPPQAVPGAFKRAEHTVQRRHCQRPNRVNRTKTFALPPTCLHAGTQ